MVIGGDPSLNIGGNTFRRSGLLLGPETGSGILQCQNVPARGVRIILRPASSIVEAPARLTYSNTDNFYFPQSLTASTFNSPDLTKSGDQFATFLLGALDGQSQMIGGPAPITVSDFFGIYIGDDWKVSRNVTINLGVRDEYETAWHDPQHQLSQGLNLTFADPAITANPPQMPPQVLAIAKPTSYAYNGLWEFTNSGHPGMWNAPKLALQPRFGIAYRVNDKTALRFGYAMYTIPTEFNFTAAPISGFEDVNFLEPPFFGMTGLPVHCALAERQAAADNLRSLSGQQSACCPFWARRREQM